MPQKPWFTANVHAPGTGVALGLIGLSLLPVGLVSVLLLSCMAGPGAYASGDALGAQRVRYCMGG